VKSYNYYSGKILILVFVVFLLLDLTSCRYIRQRLSIGEYSLKSALEWARKDSTRVADSLKRVMADKKTFERTLTDSLMNLGDKNLSDENIASSYNIIIGSFTSHENARQAVRQCSAQGYKASIINSTGSDGTMLELVSAKTFRDHTEASIFLREVQAKHYPRAWIYSGTAN
jgi:hypothetical protein